MGLAVHRVGGLSVRRVNQAEDLALAFVDPVSQVLDPVPFLLLQVLYVGLRHIFVGGSGQVVNVHVEWHFRLSPFRWFAASSFLFKIVQPIRLALAIRMYLGRGGSRTAPIQAVGCVVSPTVPVR